VEPLLRDSTLIVGSPPLPTNITHRVEAKRCFVLKKDLFSILILPMIHFEWVLNENSQTLAELDNILQNVVRDYGFVKYLTVVNTIPWK
jgi:hypothetical protein